MADVTAREFEWLLVWKAGRFDRPLVECLNSIEAMEDYGI